MSEEVKFVKHNNRPIDLIEAAQKLEQLKHGQLDETIWGRLRNMENEILIGWSAYITSELKKPRRTPPALSIEERNRIRRDVREQMKNEP